MSLQAQPIPPVPELTAPVAHAAFRKGNAYMQMRDLLGTFFTDDQFVDLILSPDRGCQEHSPINSLVIAPSRISSRVTRCGRVNDILIMCLLHEPAQSRSFFLAILQ